MNNLWVVCAVGGGSPKSQAHEQDALGDPSELIDHHGFQSALRVRPSLSSFTRGWESGPRAAAHLSMSISVVGGASPDLI